MSDHKMTYGACVPVEFAPAFADVGWDFVEVLVDDLLCPTQPDAQWTGLQRARQSPIPVRAANRLVPADLKVVGPNVSPALLRERMRIVAERANLLGMEVLVFGSGLARTVPDGFDREDARQQILEFCQMAAEFCGPANVTLVAEPLNRFECNIILSVAEAMTYVKQVNHPAFQCLVDSFHLWLENEPLANVEKSMEAIRHVHLADVKKRAAPGDTGENDYRPLFALLQRGGYHGMMTVESDGLAQEPDAGRKTLAFLKEQWRAAQSM